jgi:hypothetical protein
VLLNGFVTQPVALVQKVASFVVDATKVKTPPEYE